MKVLALAIAWLLTLYVVLSTSMLTGWSLTPKILLSVGLTLVAAAFVWDPLRSQIAREKAPELRVGFTAINPHDLGDHFTYVRLDIAVTNTGGTPASDIIVKLAIPGDVETAAQYYARRQPTPPGEGEFKFNGTKPDYAGYRTATAMLTNGPSLQGHSVIAYAVGTAVFYARDGNYALRWEAHCKECPARPTIGAIRVHVRHGHATLSSGSEQVR